MTTAVDRVTRACDAMAVSGGPMPVADLARWVHVSARQLQRDFAQVLGVSPREYGQALRAGRTRTALRSTESVTEAMHSAGYGSVRAFYEQVPRRLGMTPSEYAAGAPEQVLVWSVAPTAVGDVLAVATPRGLAAVRIGRAKELAAEVAKEFAAGTLVRDDAAMADVMSALCLLARGDHAPALPCDVAGTAFQARVWSALQDIPPGETRTYAEVAAAIGRPGASRAVARACATNQVALVIPCHRVVRVDGQLAGYRWGVAVKRELLQAERR